MVVLKKHVLTLLALCIASATMLNAQGKLDEYPYPDIRTEEYKDYVKDKKHEQQDKFLDRKYTHPAPPKHQLEVGLDLGLLMVSGDVKAKPGFGIGGHVRKALGYSFSLRGNVMLGTTTGRNWQGSVGWNNGGQSIQNRNASLLGDQLGDEYVRFNTEFNGKVPDYSDQGIVFHNYQTKIREATISGVWNMNNIKFHKRRNTAALYGYAGIGGMMYQTYQDMLDADGNEYNYAGLGGAVNWDNDEERAGMIDVLDNLWDGSYESMAEKHFDDYGILGTVGDVEDEWSYNPTAHVGIGISFKLGRRVNFGIDSKVTYTNDDLLDGQRYDEEGSFSRDYDTYVFSSANLNINLGGDNTVEPLWWMSPLDYAYQELDNAPCCDDLDLPDLADDDNDGVPNVFDVEPDSREDCPVDTKGRMLDSDKDGILDCDDCQPYTPRHLIDQINDCGAAFEEFEFDCDMLKNCAPMVPPKPPCDDSMLPNVLFDLGSTKVKPDFEGQLAAVAQQMQANPDMRLCVVGHTDNRGNALANSRLSWKRANEVANFLVEKHGVPRSRLIVQYAGEDQPVVGGLSDGSGRKGIDAQHALNRRVDFKCCMDGQFDMPKP